MLNQLRELLGELRQLKRDVSKEPGPRIAKSGLRKRAEASATHWFSTVSPELTQHPLITAETIEQYSSSFAVLYASEELQG